MKNRARKTMDNTSPLDAEGYYDNSVTELESASKEIWESDSSKQMIDNMESSKV